MEDQVTRDGQVERWRAWNELTEAEKAAALSALGKYLLHRHTAWTQEAAALAMLVGLEAELRAKERLVSPIQWRELSREQMSARLVEMADWVRDEGAAPMMPVHDACLDVAEDLRRTRTREGRGR